MVMNPMWEVDGLEPLNVLIPDWIPAKAEQEFLTRFLNLVPIT